MIITHNLQAMNTTRIVNANIAEHAKSTSKISSGYRINRAADNPSGLAISETMRKQLRGLMQGINNTKDGIAFVQIADGAMDEIHTMLQRMNELSLKALNGLCTQEERIALNAEFDQLRTEIDRIDATTTFNTMPVFDKHEASYYQICGNRQWKDNELHTISASENELNIHLPDGYEPKDYTLTVPAGTYTTQELIDEIDSALSKMDPPNPGFVFEFTSDGYCNLNFESAEGKPTNIEMIDGSLAYLIYDFQPGGSPASLLGTSAFKPKSDGSPGELSIKYGQNDELIFFAESAEGMKEIHITIDAPVDGEKKYTRDQMIDEINKKLQDVEGTDGIVAKPYGDYYIQITGGDKINITGLKGNMFKYEPDYPKYTSVFYDNAVYGACDKESAQITGYDQTFRIKIYADTANKNNILYFKLDEDTDVKTITLPAGDYTVSELTTVVNDALRNEGLDDKVEAVYTGSRMEFVSKKMGTHSKLNFTIDSTVDPADAKIYRKTYETLFLSVSGYPIKTGQPASLTGSAYLSGTIELGPDASLTFAVNGKPYTVGKEIIGGDHASLDSLVSKLNSYVSNNPELNGKIEFAASGGRLVINSKSDDVSSITIADTNETYRKLFTSSYSRPNGYFSGGVRGHKLQGQGDTSDIDVKNASINASPCKVPVTIDSSNSHMTISLRRSEDQSLSGTTFNTINIDLDPGTYNTMDDLARQINSKLSGGYADYVKVSYAGNTLTFTFEPSKDDESIPDGWWDISLSHTSAWDNGIFETVHGTSGPYIQYAGSPKITSRYSIPYDITLDQYSQNNELTITAGGITRTLTINGTCNSRADVLTALQNAIANSPFNGIVEASLEYGSLCLTATGQTLDLSGTFYDEVICKGVTGSPYSYRSQGTCKYDDTLVIGRRDLTTGPIEIVGGFNDTLTFDFTYNKDKNSTEDAYDSFAETIDVTIPEGIYQNGQELVNVLNASIKQQFGKDGDSSDHPIFGVDGDFNLSFSVGGYETDVSGNIDPYALQITASRKTGKEPGEGEYIIDGVRGNASCFVFYKTASLPKATYIVGTKDISEGITFEPGKNVLTLSANDIPYQYTFEENKYYTADEFIAELNKRFNEGDDNGNQAPLRATLENGAVKIWHKTIGANTITDIGGSGRSTIFFEEEGRDSRDPLILQVGAEQRSTIELPRLRVDSCSLSINSLTISQAKYAEKAVEHIKDAIKALSDRRSIYGAMQNRLEHTVNNNENVTEQVQAGESRIRDTDMSSELIRYSNLNLLLQAGHKMIAHSNNNIKKLLTILE